MTDLVYMYNPEPEPDAAPAGVTAGWVYIGTPKVGETLIGIKAAMLHEDDGTSTLVFDGEPFEAVVTDA